MAKFNAGAAVEKLQYDFTDFNGPEGDIMEPSTGRVNAYFDGMKALMKDVNTLRKSAGEEPDFDSMTEEDMAEAVGKMDEATAQVGDYQRRSVQLLAHLCGGEWEEQKVEDADGNVLRTDQIVVGGSPDFETLNDLPFRVLSAFTQWLIQEIRPNQKAPAGKR